MIQYCGIRFKIFIQDYYEDDDQDEDDQDGNSCSNNLDVCALNVAGIDELWYHHRMIHLIGPSYAMTKRRLQENETQYYFSKEILMNPIDTCFKL